MNKSKIAILTSALLMTLGGNAYAAGNTTEARAPGEDAAGRQPSNQMRPAAGATGELSVGGTSGDLGIGGVSSGATDPSTVGRNPAGTARGLDNTGSPTVSPSAADARVRGNAIRPEQQPPMEMKDQSATGAGMGTSGATMGTDAGVSSGASGDATGSTVGRNPAGTARGLDNTGSPTVSPSAADARVRGNAIRPEEQPPMEMKDQSATGAGMGTSGATMGTDAGVSSGASTGDKLNDDVTIGRNPAGTARGLDNTGSPTVSPSAADARVRGNAIRPEQQPPMESR